jgi:hypothetical protein
MHSMIISLLLTCATTVVFLALSPATRHWFVIPALACGVIIGCDAVDWFRGRFQLLDPAGLVGLLGYHVFFFNPLLVAAWDHRMRYLPEQPEDYRPWLGILSTILFVALLAYRSARSLAFRRIQVSTRPVWKMHYRRFWIVLGLALIVSATLQAWVYYSLGGISGYIGAYSTWLRGGEAFQGTAPLFAVSESFPILLMMGFAVWSWGAKWRRQWIVLGMAIAIFAVLVMIFGGLRGSRSNSIWGLFWAVGMIHLYVRRVSRTLVLAGIPVLLVFLGAYAIYKNHGNATMDFLSSVSSYDEIQSGSERAEDILLGDLGRSDVQAFLVYRIFQREREFEYAWGRSYLGAIAMVIPRSVWPDRIPAKAKWTTEAEFGPGKFESAEIISTRVYGLAGEAMLNFGPLFVPVAFAVLGVTVAWLRRFITSLELGDCRRLIVPFLCNFCFLLLLNDSDNQVFYLMKYGLFPGIVILAASGEYNPRRVAARYPYASSSQPTRLTSARAF